MCENIEKFDRTGTQCGSHKLSLVHTTTKNGKRDDMLDAHKLERTRKTRPERETFRSDSNRFDLTNVSANKTNEFNDKYASHTYLR